MTESKAKFEHAKARVMRFSEVLAKAETPEQLRALMLADTTAFYHSYDMLELLTFVENIGCDIAESISEGFDFDGAPL